MAGIAIVAIPEQDDPVWKVSSEKVPHLTLLYLEGPLDNEENTIRFVQHAAKVSLKRFGMSVDRRGILGAENADVAFLDKHYGGKELLAFRGYLLTNTDILSAYQKAEQYPVWTPHVTLGFPDTPAKPLPNNMEKLYWINFDRIAVWTGDYVGPEFVLEEDRSMEVDVPGSWSEDDFGQWLRHHEVNGLNWGVRQVPEVEEEIEHVISSLDDFLEHFGVRGMKWGVRRSVGPDGRVLGKPPGLAKKSGGKSDDELTPVKIKRGKGSADHQRMVKNLDKKMENLSTADIKAVTARLQAMKNLKAETAAQKAAKASMVKKITSWALGEVVTGAKKAGGDWIQKQTGIGINEVLPKDLLKTMRESKSTSKTSPSSKDTPSTTPPKTGSTRSEPKVTLIGTSNRPSSPERDKAVAELAEQIVDISSLPKKKGG